jgi:hypothetical protein
MFAIPQRRRLLGPAAVCVGLALAAVGFGAGVAAAAPSPPAPADIPFLPTPSDPGSVLPATPSPVGLQPDAGGLVPLVADTIKLMSASGDPNAYIGNTQNLLNDVGSLLGVPGGMPNVGSLVPQNTVPNAASPLAPPASLSPLGTPVSPAPLSPLGTPVSPAPLSPLGTPMTPPTAIPPLAAPTAIS